MASATHLLLFAQNALLALLALVLLGSFANARAAQIASANIFNRWRTYRAGVICLVAGVLVSLANAYLGLDAPAFLLVNLLAYVGYYAGSLQLILAARGARAWRWREHG